MSSSLQKAAAAYIAQHEGSRNEIYKDHKGNYTIGIGHLVKPSEHQKYKGKKLTADEVQGLFDSDLDDKVASAKRKLGDVFDSFPESLQVAVVDGFFRGDLSGSPKTLKLLKEKKFSEAADEYLDNAEYKNSLKDGTGVAPRMSANAARMREASVRKLSTESPLKLTGPLASF